MLLLGEMNPMVLTLEPAQVSGQSDVADFQPTAIVIIPDASSIHLPWVPPILNFQFADKEQPWILAQIFNLVLSRLLHECTLTWWLRMYESATNASQPGDYIECQELSHHWRLNDDNVQPNSYLFGSIQVEDIRLGSAGVCNHIQPIGQKIVAEFEILDCTIIKMPIGPLARRKTVKEIGKLNYCNLYTFLESVSVKLFA